SSREDEATRASRGESACDFEAQAAEAAGDEVWAFLLSARTHGQVSLFEPRHEACSRTKRDLVLRVPFRELREERVDRASVDVRGEIDAGRMKLGVLVQDRPREAPYRRAARAHVLALRDGMRAPGHEPQTRRLLRGSERASERVR